jgi:hypothetical protein
MKVETCHGGKKSKEHLTVLLCSHAKGSEKLKPLVVRKFAKLRCIYPPYHANIHTTRMHI